MLVRMVRALWVIFIFYNFYNLFFHNTDNMSLQQQLLFSHETMFTFFVQPGDTLEGLRTEDKDERKVF